MARHLVPEFIVTRANSPLNSPDIIHDADGSLGNYRQNMVISVKRIITFDKSRGYKFTNSAGR